MRFLSFLLAVPFAASLTGCIFSQDDGEPPPPAQQEPPASNPPPVSIGEPARSSDYEVNFIFASMHAESDGNSAHVVVALIANAAFGKNYLRLTGDDRLTTRLGDDGPERELVPVSGGSDNLIRYEAFLPHSETTSRRVIVSFLRAAGRPNAGLSEVTLAEPFEVANAPSTVKGSGTEVLLLSNDAPTNAELVGDCISGEGNRAVVGSSVGNELALSARLPLRQGFSSCDAFLDVRRATRGKVDSAFQRGGFDDVIAFEGLQQRSFKVRVATSR